jgi:hypothetical protein
MVMEMPQLTSAHEAMRVMLGEWRGEERMEPSPWIPGGGVRKARVVNAPGLGGFAVIQDYLQEGEAGAPGFEGHAVIYYDGRAAEYVMHWFDSFSPSEFRGGIKDGAFVLTARSPQGLVRSTWRFDGERAYAFRMETSADGASWAPMMEGTYRKVRSASAKAGKPARTAGAKGRPKGKAAAKKPSRTATAAKSKGSPRTAGGRKSKAKAGRARGGRR